MQPIEKARRLLLPSCLLIGILPAHALAQGDQPAESGGASSGTLMEDENIEPAATEEPQGILPIPDFGVSFWDRAYMTGDWNGARAALAEDAGVQVDMSLTQYWQSIVDGGFEEESEYGGTLDTEIKIDLMRMGIMPGAVLDIRGLSRYGDFLWADAAQVAPVNSNAVIPETAPLYDDYELALTNVSYTQFFSEHFAAYAGKLDTFNGDQNEFATGRGATQFMNYNFVFAAPTLIVPASALGIGILWLPTKWIMIQSTVLNSQNTTNTTGFDDIRGGFSATEARFQYRLGDLPGGMNTSFIYMFNNPFVDLGKVSLDPGLGEVDVGTEEETWMAILSGWQYLTVEEAPADGPLNLMNGKPDLQGFGIFGRVAFADKDVNPYKFNASLGIGSRGLIPNRDDDVLGLAVYYTDIDKDEFALLDELDTSEQGLEAFYSIAITPAVQLTFDVQWLDSPLPDSGNDTVIFGSRLRTSF